MNRARFSREGVEGALHSSLARWGLVEAGARFGRVRTDARAGIDLAPATDQVGTLFGRLFVDSLDDREWPDKGLRVALAGDWNVAGLGADRRYWRLEGEVRSAHAIGLRTVAQLDAFAGIAGRDLPVYERHRIGGPVRVPGYHHEELKGRQALAAAVSARVRVFGSLRAVVRAGAGNVFERTSDLTLDGLRWGLAVGAYHPSPVGPVSFELGTRNGGGLLTSLRVGWD